MTTVAKPFDETATNAPADFSVVLGGPLFQLWRRSRLTGNGLELLHRRIAVLVGVSWIPLLLLSVAEGRAWGGSETRPFLYDIEAHVRQLVALPLLIVAEMVVHQRMRPVVQQFLSRGLIPDSQRPAFDAAVASAMRLRNSLAAEILLIALVLIVGTLLGQHFQIAQTSATWYGSPSEDGMRATLAGQWLRWISMPLFQFVLLRWYFRLFIWGRFLWQVSRLDLKLMPLHPDASGGLAFVSGVSNAFVPVLTAQGAQLAGLMANRIFYAGATLPEFKLELIGLVAMMVFAVLGPLLFFSPMLAAAKRQGARDYGILAQRYIREFDHKWLRSGSPPDEPLVGSADIQSLADMGGSFEMVKNMRWVPFSTQNVLHLAVATLVPVLPLTLTLISLDELVERLLKAVF